MELVETQALIFYADAKNSAPIMEEINQLQEETTMLKNIVNCFEEMMNQILNAFNESMSDPYAGWNEGEELLMLNDVRCGIR